MGKTWKDWIPNRKFNSLNSKQNIINIDPVFMNSKTKYFPCDVIIENNVQVKNVYLVEAKGYYLTWGNWPDEDEGKRYLPIESVKNIMDATNRLPAKIAQKIYDDGETGMGYFLFKLLFKDGEEQAYLTGGAVDFVSLPIGKTMDDIIEVKLHEGRDDINRMQGLDFYWCLYSE